MKKTIEVISPCYNECENIELFYQAVREQFEDLSDYSYSHLFIDNGSTDGTVDILRRICKQDKRVKVILNIKNFGPLRSHFYGFIHTDADAVISMVVDFQEPVEMIPQMVKEWENGHDLVACIKNQSKENPVVYGLRKAYYKLIKSMSETEHLSNFTGFGLYDRSLMEMIKQVDDPYPYLRGIVMEFASNYTTLNYTQPKRLHGKSNFNFLKYYDFAMMGFINQSKIPLRLASFIGLGSAILSLMVALFYLIYKLCCWDNFELGQAPLVVGLFFFTSVQLFFIGVIGEYVGAIFTQVRKRPLVIEKERINFV